MEWIDFASSSMLGYRLRIDKLHIKKLTNSNVHVRSQIGIPEVKYSL